jgi:hypothetical protein
MNELTREASKQTILEAISFMWLGGRGEVRKSRKTPQKPLKHDFSRYTTDVYGSECQIIEDWDTLSFKWGLKPCDGGINIGQFKQACEDIDNE